MLCEILMNLYIWSDSIDLSYSEEYIEYSKKSCIGCIPYYTSSDYMFLNKNEEVPKSHHKVFIFNQEYDF